MVPKYSKERVAQLVEQTIMSVKPQFCEDTRIMELTMQQFRALAVLYTGGPMRMSNISSQLGIGMPAVTSLVSKLEDKGLVMREHNNKDRRVVFCCITGEGKSEIESFWRVKREHIQRIIGALSDDERQLVAHATQVMTEAINRMQENWEVDRQTVCAEQK